uniref:Uncharacterized protein n=1 Tax=Physcomitrium patens TaxID=3218 RepID=A0A2K1L1D8_PHYPA|nr:hypothetical protein PHYPA_002634 [Physcomitrium patens]
MGMGDCGGSCLFRILGGFQSHPKHGCVPKCSRREEETEEQGRSRRRRRSRRKKRGVKSKKTTEVGSSRRGGDRYKRQWYAKAHHGSPTATTRWRIHKPCARLPRDSAQPEILFSLLQQCRCRCYTRGEREIGQK